MKNHILFISDLHIALEKTEITQRFLRFLTKRATGCQALYILGDLFDAWIGDDDDTPPSKTIKQALKQLTDSGVAVYLLQGNRDFLLGQTFSRQTGVKLLDDYAVIDLGGQPVLLTHGDLLCSDDVAYQMFRLKSHDPAWQNSVLSKPLWLRLLAARWYRLRSYFHKRNKTPTIMDVNQQTVEDAMRRHNCQTLIHGHTHRPARHTFELDGKPAQRWVLADWKKHGADILCWNGQAFETETF
ncbi:MAG: UDP-2,3-diacylglucosamine diphosphatase [Methylomonas sp.]|nr:MAG: UDP-2,3-diacylglucosamine diphosphatase [Methylomonas sp.]PPD26107.1 MAG: UDP-2,3-diacylglucosamine diphosphatase [Methylomonas sp.]PPD37823.1 MAG: UDP-2,3-diacylglucosamine diphosphatase [Methylomonas sp.]PPD38618.1 MAG: UDP-2,3-diacylglucosamine diphosphatase [Methylomonas sp.]PPD55323.1 MAG: UDP-2,3-diacylglucosamine diphosphatase [Methylomonas sp.]